MLGERRPKWEEKVDPRSGRKYYANIQTRTTQWHKPIDFGASVAVPFQGQPSPRNSQQGVRNSSVQSQHRVPGGNRQQPVQTAFVEKPKMKVYEGRTEKKKMEELADVYSIILATEHLEKAFVRDAITNDVYTKTCKKLISQYKTAIDSMGDTYMGINNFMKDYSMKCQRAAIRFQQGVPATIYHGGAQSQEEKGAELNVFHCVQHFITLMDSLKLEMKAVDELHPSLSDLMESINKVSDLPPDHDAKVKVKKWLLKLNQLKASDELDDEDVRQMLMDLDQAYNSFHKFIETRK